MGIVIQPPGAAFTTNVGKYSAKDSRLHNGVADGALYLIDAVHSLGGLGTAGLPANGASIPNIVADNLGTLTGQTDTSKLNSPYISAYSAATMVMERTPKGMLHGAVNQTSPVNNEYAVIRPPMAVIDHMYAHQTNKRIYFLAGKITRTAKGSEKWASLWTAQPEANNKYFMLTTAGFSGVDRSIITPGPNDTSAPFLAIGIDSSISGTLPDGFGYSAVVAFGPHGSYGTVTTANKPGSFAFASSGCFDLTIAGTDEDTAIGQIQDWFTAEFMTEGGKYYGDTPTDPATLAGG